MKKLPKRIFVVWDKPDKSGPEFLLADEDWRGHATMSGPVTVGRYELVQTLEVSAPATSKHLTGKRNI